MFSIIAILCFFTCCIAMRDVQGRSNGDQIGQVSTSKVSTKLSLGWSKNSNLTKMEIKWNSAKH